jgi:hypothetical protein
MELALRQYRGLGAGLTIPQCFEATSCRAATDLACYTTGWYTDFCRQWRAYDPSLPNASDIPRPTAATPPAIDANPSSPTYGQAMVNGHVVATEADVQALIDQQIAAQAAAERAAVQAAMERQAAGQCAVTEADCTQFQRMKVDCSGCEIDFTKPVFAVLAFMVMGLLIAVKK